MNASIYGMNHSQRTQEQPTGDLPIERDLVALHKALIFATDETSARLFGQSMTGKSYDEKCACYVEALARECDADERTIISALQAAQS